MLCSARRRGPAPRACGDFLFPRRTHQYPKVLSFPRGVTGGPEVPLVRHLRYSPALKWPSVLTGRPPNTHLWPFLSFPAGGGGWLVFLPVHQKAPPGVSGSGQDPQSLHRASGWCTRARVVSRGCGLVSPKVHAASSDAVGVWGGSRVHPPPCSEAQRPPPIGPAAQPSRAPRQGAARPPVSPVRPRGWEALRSQVLHRSAPDAPAAPPCSQPGPRQRATGPEGAAGGAVGRESAASRPQPRCGAQRSTEG